MFSIIEVAVMLLVIVVAILNRNAFSKNALITVVVILAILSVVANALVRNYSFKYDKKLITRMVAQGHMALFKVEHGTFEMFVKDANSNPNVIWKIEGLLQTKDNERKRITVYDQFASEQTSIPEGYVYITYDPSKPDATFVIPNMLVGAFTDNKELIESYQKNVKGLKYLNVYYKKGLVMESFKTTLEKQHQKEEEDKEFEETNI